MFREEETAVFCKAVLPLIERERLYHLGGAAIPGGELPDGYPVVAVHGEKGPQVRGYLRYYKLAVIEGLHIVESLNRSPAALAEMLAAAGGGALEQVGRALAARRRER